MSFKNRPVLLYFLANAVPTDGETKEALKLETALGAVVRFRNGRHPGEGGTEKCTYVAGTVPANYRATYTFIDDVGNAHEPPKAGTDEIGKSAASVDAQTSIPSSLAAEVGTVSGGWGTP